MLPNAMLLKPFSSDNITPWLQKYIHLIGYASDDQKLDQLQMFLADKALDLYTRERRYTVGWNQFKKHIEKKFSTCPSAWEVRKQLVLIKMSENEKLETYLNRFEDCLEPLQDSLPNVTELVEYFLHGLNIWSVRRELTELLKTPRNPFVDWSNVHQEIIRYLDVREEVVQKEFTLHSKITELVYQVEQNINEKIAKLTKSVQALASTLAKTSMNPTSSSTFTRGQCFNCKLNNHYCNKCSQICNSCMLQNHCAAKCPRRVLQKFPQQTALLNLIASTDDSKGQEEQLTSQKKVESTKKPCKPRKPRDQTLVKQVVKHIVVQDIPLATVLACCKAGIATDIHREVFESKLPIQRKKRESKEKKGEEEKPVKPEIKEEGEDSTMKPVD